MTAREFFAFDAKDTLRLAVWIVICAFTLGTFYSKRESDLEDIENKRSQLDTKIQRELVLVQNDIRRIDSLITMYQTGQAAISASLEGVRTELKFVNEKIDILRIETRARTNSGRDD